jgi:hypothetical protein
MNTSYFYWGKPHLPSLVNDIVWVAQSFEIELTAIALVGGWAREARQFGGEGMKPPLSAGELQRLIEPSSKISGDVDFVAFVKTDLTYCQSVFSATFSHQDQQVDLVCSRPASVRFPGILLLLPSLSCSH